MQIIKKDVFIQCTNISNDSFNLVINSHFTNQKVNEKIDEIVKIFQDKKLSFSW